MQTYAVAASTQVGLTVSAGNVSRLATLTVNPPVVSALSLKPSSVEGGASSVGTVTLTGASTLTATGGQLAATAIIAQGGLIAADLIPFP